MIMNYKVTCEVVFPRLSTTLDVSIPINKTIEYICKMLDQLIHEAIAQNYIPRDTSIIVNKRTGTVYDKNVLVKDTDIGNGTKLIYF